MGDLGTLQAVGFAVQLTAGVLVGKARFEASFADWASQSDTASQPGFASQGTTLHPMQGAARGCFRWERSARLEIDPCLGASLTSVTSHGFEENQKYTRQASWGSIVGEAIGGFTLAGPLALRASLGLAVPLAPPSFVIDRSGGPSPILIHQPSSVDGRASLGLEVRFP
jgi:hypothetical protein